LILIFYIELHVTTAWRIFIVVKPLTCRDWYARKR